MLEVFAGQLARPRSGLCSCRKSCKTKQFLQRLVFSLEKPTQKAMAQALPYRHHKVKRFVKPSYSRLCHCWEHPFCFNRVQSGCRSEGGR